MKRIFTRMAALALCLSAAILPASAETPAYRVGICQLVQHAALDDASAGFRDALSERLGVDVVFLEQNASGDLANCMSIVNNFIAEDVDLILANATPALQAAYAATGDIPILGASITDYAAALDIDDWTGVSSTNVSGVSDLAPLQEQAEMLCELFPEAREVGLLYCSSEANSEYQIEGITEALTQLGYHCTSYAFTDTSDVFSVTEAACLESDVLYIPTDNIAASCVSAIRNAVETAGMPILGGDEGICAGCGVATLCVDYYKLGRAAGEMAWEILVNGADISAMPIAYDEAPARMYNPELSQLLGVSIPEGYQAIGE